ncbi:pyruvate, water dikinase [Saccharopolyspora erythraea]|nr:pyruvate, water dikinase [Saccharopolyspora erythraea]
MLAGQARRQVHVIDLAEIDASMVELVGGKAAGLGEMIRAGRRVPAGFCLTTEAHRSGAIPVDQLVDAYTRLGAGRVAVRSSGTAEDLADASFAGQQDTLLDVEGADGLVEAVQRCWDSLWSERAVAYRRANGIADEGVRMAVVVQRMVDAEFAGVLFTANPLTGCRTEMVVDATRGLGTAVVDGSGIADHYVLDGGVPPESGCLDRPRLQALREVGGRLQDWFGVPQDVEWAIDHDGTLWLLQSRPITTLFPLPANAEASAQPRAYFEVGHMQGMLRPFTPAGMSALHLATGMWFEAYGVEADSLGAMGVVDAGGRLYLDLTELLRSKWFRARLPEAMHVYGPRCVEIVERLLADPRFAPERGLPFRVSAAFRMARRLVPEVVAGIARTLARPAAARARAFRCTEEIRRRSSPPPGLATAADRLRFVEDVQKTFLGREAADLVWSLMTGILVSQIPGSLLKGIATEAELNTVLGGLPHNVTTEMDLALWRLVRDLDDEHRELLRTTSPAEAAEMYREGRLADIGLTAFLDAYGHRAAAEVDIGVPRWSEDPTPLFATIANYLRITDSDQAPDRRFERAAAAAEAKIDELVRRARRTRPVRGRLAAFFLRRTRELTGLRELGKFAWLYPLAETRRQVLLVGDDLMSRGLLDRADDIMFLDFREMGAAVRGTDQRELVRARRAVHERELRRRRVPVALLSDGTDLEAVAPYQPPADGTLTGMGAAPGRATGRARVVHDPATAHIEPGEILVAPTTDPGWTPLFLSAGGLVTETGSPTAHGPTVAREYGIPAVICVRDATQRIQTGDLISVDGSAGIVQPEGERESAPDTALAQRSSAQPGAEQDR